VREAGLAPAEQVGAKDLVPARQHVVLGLEPPGPSTAAAPALVGRPKRGEDAARDVAVAERGRWDLMKYAVDQLGAFVVAEGTSRSASEPGPAAQGASERAAHGALGPNLTLTLSASDWVRG
jgi:hypothetical protein